MSRGEKRTRATISLTIDLKQWAEGQAENDCLSLSAWISLQLADIRRHQAQTQTQAQAQAKAQHGKNQSSS